MSTNTIYKVTYNISNPTKIHLGIESRRPESTRGTLLEVECVSFVGLSLLLCDGNLSLSRPQVFVETENETLSDNRN